MEVFVCISGTAVWSKRVIKQQHKGPSGVKVTEMSSWLKQSIYCSIFHTTDLC